MITTKGIGPDGLEREMDAKIVSDTLYIYSVRGDISHADALVEFVKTIADDFGCGKIEVVL
jgi:hypothetical protein